MFDPIENIMIVGITIKIDKELNQIKMRWPNNDYDWIKIDNIISANVYQIYINKLMILLPIT
jgi:hypothetical protein